MSEIPSLQRAAVAALLRDDVLAMQGYTPGEQVNDCLKLNTNECAWPPSPAVQACLSQLSGESMRLYPDPMSHALREAAAALWGHPANGIVAGNGSDDCLTMIYRSVLRPGDRVAVPWPTYGLYDTLASIQGVEMLHVAWQDHWQLPIQEFIAAAPRLILVANPNNPSATMVSVQELVALAEALPQSVVVVDEAYIDYATADSSCIPALLTHSNMLVLRTCSKSYALAGARLGFCLGNPEIIAQFCKVKDSYNVNALTQAVGLAAIRDQDYHQQLVEDTLAAREDLMADVRKRGWTWPPSCANFLLCHVGPQAESIYRALKARGILLRWWDRPQLRECLRITVGTPEDQARLFQALDEVCA
ncbi:MAG: histidinol-phosphate transaminase [Planctomycetota bacterium]|nr:MAG: histidinol-phosphate transaminase [Planctomycetota bacterium]